MEEENTIIELTQLVKSSDDIKPFLLLLRKVAERVSDVRIKISGVQNDNIELRCGIIKIIEEMLINPLSTIKPVNKQIEHTKYI